MGASLPALHALRHGDAPSRRRRRHVRDVRSRPRDRRPRPARGPSRHRHGRCGGARGRDARGGRPPGPALLRGESVSELRRIRVRRRSPLARVAQRVRRRARPPDSRRRARARGRLRHRSAGSVPVGRRPCGGRRRHDARVAGAGRRVQAAPRSPQRQLSPRQSLRPPVAAGELRPGDLQGRPDGDRRRARWPARHLQVPAAGRISSSSGSTIASHVSRRRCGGSTSA